MFGLHHPPPPMHQDWSSILLQPSVGVQGGCEDDVPADGQGGLLHFAPQHRVPHDARRLPHLLQDLVQALDAADHRALLDVRQQGDLCKRLQRKHRRWFLCESFVALKYT